VLNRSRDTRPPISKTKPTSIRVAAPRLTRALSGLTNTGFMRDPKRIERMLKQLDKAWHAFPDMRLGQLILNITRCENTSDLWNLEDDQIEQRIDIFSKKKIDTTGLRHVKRRWNETRGDRHDSFGASWWYFEIDNQCNVIRQVEQYDDGPILGYNARKSNDEFGGISTQPLEPALLGYDFITETEFGQLWERRTNA